MSLKDNEDSVIYTIVNKKSLIALRENRGHQRDQ
jgi:hypothetical protein